MLIDITILPSPSKICFTPIPYAENSGVRVLDLLEFQPLYYVLPLTNNGCIDELQVRIEGKEVIRFTIDGSKAKDLEVIEMEKRA